jgi:hypothetical protein
MTEDEFKLVFSPLCQPITEDGVTVEVKIYRGDHDAGWHLEVEDHTGGSTVWEEMFPSDVAALDEVRATIAEEGIECFLTTPGRKVH